MELGQTVNIFHPRNEFGTLLTKTDCVAVVNPKEVASSIIDAKVTVFAAFDAHALAALDDEEFGGHSKGAMEVGIGDENLARGSHDIEGSEHTRRELAKEARRLYLVIAAQRITQDTFEKCSESACQSRIR